MTHRPHRAPKVPNLRRGQEHSTLQRIIEAFHAGRLDRETYVRALTERFSAEFAHELGRPLSGDPFADDDRDDRLQKDRWAIEWDVEDAPLPFPSRSLAPGLWLVLGQDLCHFCGRRLPVLALRAHGDPGPHDSHARHEDKDANSSDDVAREASAETEKEPAHDGWVRICLDDLELIRSQAEPALKGS